MQSLLEITERFRTKTGPQIVVIYINLDLED